MKVAIVGSSGHIGKELMQGIRCLMPDIDLIGISRKDSSNFDLRNPDIFNYAKYSDVDIFVFAAAVVDLELCESSFNECWNINVTGTEYFISKILKYGKRILFFSSDTVFESDCFQKEYNELSFTKPASAYGKMKKHVEDCFEREPGLFKSLRLSYVLSGEDKFIKYCKQCLEKKQTAEVYHPFYRNVVTMNTVIETVGWFIKNWDKYPYSNLCVGGSELISRIRIIDEFNSLLDDKIPYSIVYPGDEFYSCRNRTIRIKSVYKNQYGIYKEDSFSNDFYNQLKSNGII